MSRLQPKLISLLKEGYSFPMFGKDIIAGLVVGILALPLSLAFAIASGARPEQGLYTAVVAGMIAALLSGSRYQISGPTGAFIVLVASTISTYGYEGMLIATMMAGVFLIFMGLARLGDAIKFVPYPVIIGFTSGIALIIFSTQVTDFLGMTLQEPLPSDFIGKWGVIARSLGGISPFALLMGIASIAIVIYWPRVCKWMPGSLIAIVVMTLLTTWCGIPVETVGDRFGTIPNALPEFNFPSIPWGELPSLVVPAIAIALLAGIESLLSAVVADGMTGHRHRSDMELVAQGFANLGASLVGGLPATGAIARTATNIKAGAVTPISGIVHALTVVGLLVSLGHVVTQIPLPVLSAILIVVAYNMSEWRLFLSLIKHPISDAVILFITFLLTVLVDLITGIEAGIILAAFLFIHRAAQHSRTEDVRAGLSEEEDIQELQEIHRRGLPDSIDIFEIYGSLFFAAAEKFKQTLTRIHRQPKVLILRMRHMTSIDGTGIRALEDILEQAKRNDTTVLIAGLRQGVSKLLQKAGVLERLPEGSLHKEIFGALDHAKELTGAMELEKNQ